MELLRNDAQITTVLDLVAFQSTCCLQLIKSLLIYFHTILQIAGSVNLAQRCRITYIGFVIQLNYRCQTCQLLQTCQVS